MTLTAGKYGTRHVIDLSLSTRVAVKERNRLQATLYTIAAFVLGVSAHRLMYFSFQCLPAPLESPNIDATMCQYTFQQVVCHSRIHNNDLLPGIYILSSFFLYFF